MLRAMHRQLFLKVLENSYFGIDNFIVEFPAAGNKILNVVFISDERFVFSLSAPDNDGDFISWECPAIDYIRSKPYISKSINEAVTKLEGWMERVKEEVVAANPFARELASFKVQVDLHLSQIQDRLGEFFSHEEAAEIEKRLEEFDKKMEKISEKNDQLQEDLDSLRRTVADLQSALATVNKGTWFRMTAGRLLSGLKVLAKSKEGREFALEAAKKVLLEGPK